MLTSYFLSRTLVPTLVRFLLEKEAKEHTEGHQGPPGLARRFFAAFDRGFGRMRANYGRWLAWALDHRVLFVTSFLGFVVASVVILVPLLGRDFFPSVDAGLIKLHVRGSPGLRIEETERRFAEIENTIRTVIPPTEIATLLDNMGVPNSGLNLSLSEGALISPSDGQILIALKEDHAPTADYVRKLRTKLHQEYPESTFFFLAPDISTQVLNFGLAAPIDVQLVGVPGKEEETLKVARQIMAEVKTIPGAVDVHLQQVVSKPQLRIDVDRTMAAQAGMTQKDVASDLLVSLSSSSQVSPSYWLDAKRGVQYLVAVANAAIPKQQLRRGRTHTALDARRVWSAALVQCRVHFALGRAGEYHPLQRGAHLRRAGQRRRHRSRLGFQRDFEDRRTRQA